MEDYLSELKVICNNLNVNEIKMFTFDYVNDFIFQLTYGDIDKRNIETTLGASVYTIDTLLELMNPELIKDIEIFNNIKVISNKWIKTFEIDYLEPDIELESDE